MGGTPAQGGTPGQGGTPAQGGDVAGMAGMGGEAPAPVVDTPALDDFAEAGAWVGANCGLSGCHLLPYPPALSSSDLERLRGVLATYQVGRCGNLPLVVPGDPDGSALVMAITGQCTDLLMPYGCVEPFMGASCISESEVDRVRAWIATDDPFR